MPLRSSAAGARAVPAGDGETVHATGLVLAVRCGRREALKGGDKLAMRFLGCFLCLGPETNLLICPGRGSSSRTCLTLSPLPPGGTEVYSSQDSGKYCACKDSFIRAEEHKAEPEKERLWLWLWPRPGDGGGMSKWEASAVLSPWHPDSVHPRGHDM